MHLVLQNYKTTICKKEALYVWQVVCYVCLCSGLSILPDGEEISWHCEVLVLSPDTRGDNDLGLDDDTLERNTVSFRNTSTSGFHTH